MPRSDGENSEQSVCAVLFILQTWTLLMKAFAESWLFMCAVGGITIN